MKKKIIIFDVDGTLADCTHRLKYVRGQKKDWNSFFTHADKDSPIESMQSLIQALHTVKRFRLVLCTGRPEGLRMKTEIWLNENKIPYEKLMMRAEKDFREDSVVKGEMLKDLGHENILFVIDDRKQAVDMWRREGLMCLQCAEGDF